jgi:Xaa-Pro aminopeptidase
MSKHDFPVEEFTARQARVRQAIADAGLDWLLVIHPVSLHWLIGTDAKSYTAFQCLPISVEKRRLVMFTRESERNEFEDDTLVDEVRGWGGREPEDPMAAFERLVDELGLKKARVGMEVPSWYLHPHHYMRLKAMLGEALVAEPSNLVHHLKLVKSPRELAYIRRSAEIAGEAMKALVATIAEGRTELELAAAAYHHVLRSGSGLPASTMNLMTGERSCFTLGAPTTRKLKRGDPGLVELGAAVKRYTSTLGRQWSLGAPSARLKELHGIMLEASDACMAEMRDGVKAIVPHEASKRVIAEAGLDRYRQHTTGYGMAPGFPPSWGEPLNMFGGSTDVLRAGMVVSVEPAVFIHEERIGVRLIDNVLITDGAPELLSRTPRDLIVVD